MKIPQDDIERVRRVAAFLRTEKGLLSAHLLIGTQLGVTVYRDGKVSLRVPMEGDTVDLEAPPGGRRE